MTKGESSSKDDKDTKVPINRPKKKEDEKPAEKKEDAMAEKKEAAPEKEKTAEKKCEDELAKKDARIKELEEALVKQQQQADNYFASLQRVSADLDNVQKRIIKEKTEIVEYANSQLLVELVDIYENFERAIASSKNEGADLKKIIAGLELIRKQYWQLLEREGVRPIAAVGAPFDPYREEAMMRVVKSDIPENTVVEEFQKGYMYKSRVLRTAKVSVSSVPPPEASDKRVEGDRSKGREMGEMAGDGKSESEVKGGKDKGDKKE